jgi:hypothetical protein
LIERLVARLVADKKLCQHLVFKGGFVGLRVYGSPRYTIDLDALLVRANIDSTLERVKKRAEMDSGDSTWFRFESQTILTTQGEYGGIRQVYRVGIREILSNIKRAQTMAPHEKASWPFDSRRRSVIKRAYRPFPFGKG